jgi:cytochrome d ubiquinol oxidase subunit II
MFRAIHVHRHDHLPFVLAWEMFGLCFVGLGICMFPYIVPTQITLWEAAAPYESQLFMIIGAGILIPIILSYTAYAYWVFRGKVDPDEGYH